MQDRTTLGIAFMVAFALIAPVMDAFAKATPAYIPVMEILGFRFGIQGLLLLPVALFLGIAHWPTRGELGLHLMRGFLILAATGLFFAAVREMPLANAIAIFFVEPFILTLLGGVFLGEAVGARRILACAVGFGGALLVIQPSFSELGLVALFPLGTALCFALYMVMTRSMAHKMHPITLQAYTALAACLLILPLLFAFDGTGHPALDPAMPQGVAILMLLGVGIVSTVSHLFISLALKFAPATTIAPLQYLEIVAATALGYFFFADMPDRLTFLGITIIVGAGLYVFARERRAEQLLARTTDVPHTP
ncbi:DMT family transporter [uncultured Lentibacter sp.]|jgi:drug/metabolite transporter (DMT)-like permease|uniref:DMT family transporter n=1 Tax=uncultured Lentibacter sp. TaxID=1659309 RepID=UPI002622BB1D|nr:DMT family transporter [uncultured Lentibacter sp.]